MVNVLSDFLGAKDWVSVCDTGFDDVDAKVVCRNLGYKDGKAQCCSGLGVRLTKYTPIGKIFCSMPLTLKAPITTAADDIIFLLFY